MTEENDERGAGSEETDIRIRGTVYEVVEEKPGVDSRGNDGY